MNTELQKIESQDLVPADPSLGAMSSALAGDLSRLSETDKLKFVGALCEMTGLNPLSKPFDWIVLNGKLTLYANKGCAEQLRKIHKVTVEILERKTEFGVHIVRVKATDATGRIDESIGAVPFDEKMAPEMKANMFMKAETKAKRRVSLSICSLGMVDESELDQIKNITPVTARVNEQAVTIDTLNEPLKVQDAVIVEAPVAAPTSVPVASEVAKVSTPPSVEDDFAKSEREQLKPAEDESETMARNLEIVFTEFKDRVKPVDCIRFMEIKGKLPKEAKGDFGKVEKSYALQILAKPKTFVSMVEAWLKGGAK